MFAFNLEGFIDVIFIHIVKCCSVGQGTDGAGGGVGVGKATAGQSLCCG